MIGIFMLAVAGLTSAAAYLLGVRPLGLAPARLGAALGKMLETVGAVLIFLVADLLVAVVLVVALRGVTSTFVCVYVSAATLCVSRGVTSTFVSVYVTDDTVWLGLALLQGLVFQGWREVSARQAGARALEQRGKLGERGENRPKGRGEAQQHAAG